MGGRTNSSERCIKKKKTMLNEGMGDQVISSRSLLTGTKGKRGEQRCCCEDC